MDVLLSLSEPWAYLLVALLAAAEGALLLGLLLPGEASMLLGGVLVYQGRASLGVMLACAAVGSVVGDSVGYWAGHYLGPRLRASRLGRRVGEERWSKANAYLRRRGGRAVFVSRFVGFLRALMPVIAGQAGFPYRRFVAYNLPAGVLWGSGFVLLGVAAGGSWHLVERWTGRATLVLVGILALALGLVAVARWLGGHLETLRARRRELLERPWMLRLRTRWRPQIQFVKHRLDPGRRLGLYLTVGLALAVLGAWVFGAVLVAVVEREEVVLLDRPVLTFLVEHREPYLTRVMAGLGLLGGGWALAGGLSIGAAWAYATTRQRRWPVFAAAALVGALGLDDLVAALVRRTPPDLRPLVAVPEFSFPSEKATAAAVLLFALSFLLTRRLSWKPSVSVWSAGCFLALLVAVSRVYLGACWPTDALAGLALGGFWTTVAATATAAWPRSMGPGADRVKMSGASRPLS